MHKAQWFPGYLWSQPEARPYIYLALGAIAAAILILASMAAWNRRLSDEIMDLEAYLEPVRTFHYSPSGELRAYDDGVVLFRNGTAVSPLFAEVWSVGWNEDREDRVLRVKHMGPDGPETASVRCGPMDAVAAGKVRDIMLHYAGG